MKNIFLLFLFLSSQLFSQILLSPEFSDGAMQYRGKHDNYGKWIGEWKCYRKDSTLSEVSYFENNVKTGKCIWYHRNGKIAGEGFYKDGKLHGKFNSFFDNGNPFYKVYYENGKTTGASESYHRNGQLYVKGNLVNFKAEGEWFTYNEDGTVRHHEVMKNGKEDKSIWPNGKPRITKTKIPDSELSTITYHRKNGTLEKKGFLKNKKQDSTWTYFDTLKNVIEIREYSDGLLHGKRVTSSYLKNKMIFTYNKGESTHYQVFTKESQTLIKEWFEKKENQPEHIKYYLNGKCAIKMFSINDFPTQLFIQYHDNDSIHLKTTELPSDSNTIILRQEYYPNGQLKQEILFNNSGIFKIQNTYALDGTELKGGTIKNDGSGKVYLYDNTGKKKEKVKVKRGFFHTMKLYKSESIFDRILEAYKH